MGEVVGVDGAFVAARKDRPTLAPAEHISVVEEAEDIEDDGDLVLLPRAVEHAELVVVEVRFEVDVSSSHRAYAFLLNSGPILLGGVVDEALESRGREIVESERGRQERVIDEGGNGSRVSLRGADVEGVVKADSAEARVEEGEVAEVDEA